MAYESNDNMVSHPNHYQSGKYEVIDVIEEFTKDLEGIEAVDTANAIKYILRWKKKNGKQDIEKAIWYLTHLKEHLEKKELITPCSFELREKNEFFNFDALKEEKEESPYRKIIDGKEVPVFCNTCKFWSEATVTNPCKSCLEAETGYPNWEYKYEKEEKQEIKTCQSCKYRFLNDHSEPCYTCLTRVGEYPKWESEDSKTKICDICKSCVYEKTDFCNEPCDECFPDSDRIYYSEKNCKNCKHNKTPGCDYPCNSCIDNSRWELK